MRLGRAALACAALAGFAACPARAADPAGSREATSYADWSGGYLGVEGSAGAAYGAYDFGPTTVGGRGVPAFTSGDSTRRSDRGVDATTALAGAFAGWNWQDGAFVYGLEAGATAANLKRPVPSSLPGFGFETVDPEFSLFRAKTDVYGSLRARLGVSLGPNLLYASFGLAGANARVLAAYPDLAGGPAQFARQDLAYLGFTLGAGVQYAISEHLALGIDYRYADLGRSDGFALGSVPGPEGGPVFSRARFTSNQVTARLTWFPDGLRLSPDLIAPQETAAAPDERFSLHGQTTLIAQGAPGFRSPYLGPNSLVPGQSRQTTTATVFLGLKLGESTELYYNPEFSQGFGLSRTLGVAGFVNGEAQKAGAPFPKLRSNRYFLRQTFNLGGESEEVGDAPNQLVMRRDIERITVVAGKFALGDFFDANAYAHDPRVDFFNWSLWAASAWDFPANLPGFTQGVMVEYNRAEFAVRAAATQVPKQPSNDVLDPRVFERQGLNVEFEERHTLPLLDRTGKLRLGLFANQGNTANYREVVDLTRAGLFADINDAAALTRRPRRKSGAYLNLEQGLTDDLGMFARFSASDGRNESLSFTDIDRSLSGGLSLKGTAWGRPLDTVGLGAARNEISPAHRAFFAEGGLGLLIGDGRLNYAPERMVEVYYAMNLTKQLTLTLDYQHVENPAYNRDRGPADFLAARLHADF